jgi:hypothetical protein
LLRMESGPPTLSVVALFFVTIQAFTFSIWGNSAASRLARVSKI